MENRGAIATDSHFLDFPLAQRDETTPSAPQQPATRSYRCQICGRTYEKPDHLYRHKRSHENARSHQCTRCPKRFNRADLLQRHVQAHDRHTEKDWPLIKRTERAAAACLACVSSKAKCEDRKPCSRCRHKNIQCEAVSGIIYPTENLEARVEEFDPPVPERSSNEGRDVTASNSTETIDVQLNQLSAKRQGNAMNQVGISPHAAIRTHNVTDTRGDDFAEGSGAEPTRPASPPQSLLGQNFSTAVDSVYTNRLIFSDDDTLRYVPNDIFHMSNTLDADMQLWAFDFENVQLGLANSPSQSLGFMQFELEAELNTSQEISRKYAAFKRSPWLWTPARNDYAMNDAAGLNVDKDATTEAVKHSPAANSVECITTNIRIDATIRDSMFGLLFSASKDNTKNRLSFPSLELLNHIIEMFFVQVRHNVESWIHAPTLQPHDTQPEFLISLVSAGSVLVSEPAVWKFGLALQDICWIVLADLMQSNNANTRDLKILQAHMLWLNVALWSGLSRKMEIAESFLLPCLTMLRRAGVFAGASDSRDLVPSTTDSEQALEVKWRKWVEHESFKRLAMHVFVHDTQASIALSKPPLIFITELEFSLPAARNLWDAPSATEWRTRYLQIRQPTSAVPCFMNLMHDQSLLDVFRDLVDVDWCRFFLLYGFWGQISAYHEANRFYLSSQISPKSATNQLWLMAQHRELYRDLKDFCGDMPNISQSPPEVVLVSHLFMMILHVSPDDLQKGAGKSGEVAARKASLLLQKWAQSDESRKAIFHGGQVFRAARMLPPAKLNGFYATALYLASLTLWTWGLVSYGSTYPSASCGQSQPDTTIWQCLPGDKPFNVPLNEPESHVARAFLSNGRGLPGLSVPSSPDSMTNDETFQSLQDPGYVLNFARRIYRENYPMLNKPLPPFTDSLRNLLKDLGNLPNSHFSRAPSVERDG